MPFRLAAALFLCAVASATDANRLAYLDETNPFYPSRNFPKLTTPQWIGDPEAEAAIILSIDDMRDPAKYEAYLRPIIDTLKKHYGRAPMSIMACSVTPADAQLQAWLREGLSIEIHTVAHPCPLLGQGRFDAAKETVESCVELMANIPGNAPVAFRMPCCDSINSLSPRFFFEIFNKPSPDTPFLRIDSSVFNITTANDSEMPREWVLRKDGRERFRTYLPFKSFVTTIEDYPYPYVIGGTCWEIPCTVPSDWEAQNINKPNSPDSVRDMKIALDAAVTKKGVYTLVFHPHGWIENRQVIELIEYAVAKYGKRIAFLSFRDAEERLRKNLLAGNALRTLTGADNGVRLLDLNHDGYMDVLLPAFTAQSADNSPTPASPGYCRIWSENDRRFTDIAFPPATEPYRLTQLRFGIDSTGAPFALMRSEDAADAWTYRNHAWTPSPQRLSGLRVGRARVFTDKNGVDQGVRLRDIDGDGRTELLVLNESQRAVFISAGRRWRRAPFQPPANAVLVDTDGNDNGLRLVDIDGDHDLDLLLSNHDEYALYLFDTIETGWRECVSGPRDGKPNAIPAIATHGQNNGAWFHSRTLWVQNEHTDRLPDLVDRRSFNDMLANHRPAPRGPAAGLASLTVRPGLRVELVAAEPLVVDPVAIAFGPDKKLWVVEMRDYPLGMDGQGKPGSRVKFLTDDNNDGLYDSATVFLDELPFATGVLPWRDGVLVTAAPLLLFARDADGDGRADARDTLFTGFGEGNQQHRINGLRWGIDNWVHAANGDSNGEVQCIRTGETVDIAWRDVRFRPDSGALETESGNAQFGIAFDDWGSRFGCANWLPVWHYVLDERYMRRNKHLAPGNPRHYVVEQVQVYPTSRTLARFNDYEHVNRTTSTCGLEIYRDTVLGDEFYGDAFVCEPVHDLVLRTKLFANNVTFAGARAPGEESAEFLASNDNWCRPVAARMGPDGALYIVDMYREVIEHPEYISHESQARIDVRAGDDKGRIYRVVPVHSPLREVPNLAAMTTSKLIEQLASPNGALRDLAHQLLIERNDAEHAAGLREMLGTHAQWHARLHALCVLDGLDAVGVGDVLIGLRDSHPAIRRAAVRIAESSGLVDPAVVQAVATLVSDADPLVRMETVCALGAWKNRSAVDALGIAIDACATDQYLAIAALSSINENNHAALAAPLLRWATKPDAAPEARGQIIPVVVALAAGSAKPESLFPLATGIGAMDDDPPAQFHDAAQFLRALADHNIALDALEGSTDSSAVGALFEEILARAASASVDEAIDESVRSAAVRLLGLDSTRRNADLDTLAKLLAQNVYPGVASAALDSLAHTGDARVPEIVLAAWDAMPAELREPAVDALMKREPWLYALVDALEQGKPSLREIDATHRQWLVTSKRDDVRARVEQLLKDVVNPDRQAVIDQFKEAANIPGQFLRGRRIFRERCASCHQLESMGHPVGPDLTAVTDRSPEALLISILDPNRAVETKYFDHRIETKDFETLNGIIVAQSENSVTIRGANGVESTVLRADIDTITSTGRSPMPDGLEDGLSVEDMGNLIAFIRDAKAVNGPETN